MRYRRLGTTGLRVSDLFLGTMTFGENWGWGAPEDECARIFEAYAEAGGNVIDTAVNYTDGADDARARRRSATASFVYGHVGTQVAGRTTA